MLHFRRFFLLTLIVFYSSYSIYGQTYTWEKLNTDAYKGKQDDIYFINEQVGWYINGYGKIYNTTNGGVTWALLTEKKGTFFRCIGFIDSLNGFVGNVGTDYFPNVTDSIPLYSTNDGGKTWNPVSYTGNYVKGVCAIDIVKEELVQKGKLSTIFHVYAVGRVGSPANFMVSHDGGKTFKSKKMNDYCNAMYDIKMFNTKEGFACASTGQNEDSTHACILHTIDGGENWEKVYESKRPFEISWKLFFPTKNVGYATIQSYNTDSTVSIQHFIKTTNGGKKWKEHILCNDYKARSFGVGFIDKKTGFIGTLNSGYKTINGGKSWNKIDLGRACNKIRIMHKPDGSVFGYAIGVNVFKLKAEK